MKFRFPAMMAVAGLMLAGCGGGGTGGVSPIPQPTGTPGAKATAKSTLTFKIPLTLPGIRVPSATRHTAAVSPKFIDGDSNGAISVYFDGQAVIDNLSFDTSDSTPVPGPGPSGSANMPDGGTFTYTSTIAYGPNGSNQVYAIVNASYNSVQGVHKIGVVQTDGPCVWGGPCIAGTQGFVLAEGQSTVTLQPGTNPAINMYLHGVLQSAYICDAGCDGGVGSMDANGAYDLTVTVADEAATAIPYEVEADGTTVVPFDNGSYQIVETDANNIVKIGQASTSYSTPGTADSTGLYGENITVTCQNAGSTTIAAELTGTNTPLNGGVDGFTYNYGTASGDNYPAAGSLLASAGADQFFGNSMSLTCAANGTITIQ